MVVHNDNSNKMLIQMWELWEIFICSKCWWVSDIELSLVQQHSVTV